MRVGRNAPCPCGSGRKYKLCCLAEKERAEEAAFRTRRLQGELELRLEGFVSGDFGEKLKRKAWKEYGSGGEMIDPEDHEQQLFEPWFFYDWRIPSPKGLVGLGRGRGATVAEAFLAAEGERVGKLERDFIAAVRRAPFSFFDVMDREPGLRLRLRDILRGTEFEVVERSASRILQRGDVVFCRVVSLRGFALMVGAGSVVIPPGQKKGLLDLRRDLRSSLGGITTEVLHEISDELRTVYFGIRDRLRNPPVPELRNTDGEPLEFHTLDFEVESADEAFHALKSLASHSTEEELLRGAKLAGDGRIREIEFSWSREGNKVYAGMPNTILAGIAIRGRRLTVRVNSANRARKARSEIRERLGGRVTFLSAEVESVEEMMGRESHRERGPAGRAREREIEELNAMPEIQELARKMTEAHWEAWVGQQIPALDGKTPLEAVRDPEGREMVEALLADFEREQEPGGPGRPGYDFNRLRVRLGLEVLPKEFS